MYELPAWVLVIGFSLFFMLGMFIWYFYCVISAEKDKKDRAHHTKMAQ